MPFLNRLSQDHCPVTLTMILRLPEPSAARPSARQQRLGQRFLLPMVPCETSTSSIGLSALVVERIMAWMRAAKARIQKRRWRATGLRYPQVSKPSKPEAKDQRKRERDSGSEAEVIASPTPSKRREVDPEARHPVAPWNNSWLCDDQFKDWLYACSTSVSIVGIGIT